MTSSRPTRRRATAPTSTPSFYTRPRDAWCALGLHAILVPYRRGGQLHCRPCVNQGLQRYGRRRLDQRPVALVRRSLRLPPGVPLRWVPHYALLALVRAYSRQRSEPFYRPARHREYRQAALGFFPDHQWVRYGHTPQLCIPCPSCGVLARALVADAQGWTCRSCRARPHESWLSRHLANWVCAARFGLPRSTLQRLHANAVRAVSRCPHDLIALVGARNALLLERPQDLRCLLDPSPFFQRGLGRARPPWGPIHQRLSPAYPDALWDQLVSPEAYYARYARQGL